MKKVTHRQRLRHARVSSSGSDLLDSFQHRTERSFEFETVIYYVGKPAVDISADPLTDVAPPAHYTLPRKEKSKAELKEKLTAKPAVKSAVKSATKPAERRKAAPSRTPNRTPRESAVKRLNTVLNLDRSHSRK